MKTLFKDVAHLYLGCKMLAIQDPGEDEQYDDDYWQKGDIRKLSLVNIGHAQINCSPDSDSYPYAVDHETGYVCIHDFQSFKPILKQMCDMPREEMVALWGLIFWYPYPDTHGIRGIQEKNTLKSRFVLSAGLERLGIEFGGHVWADCDLSHYSHNQHAVTSFLLKQGYDLFQLIESGQAVDAKTLNK